MAIPVCSLICFSFSAVAYLILNISKSRILFIMYSLTTISDNEKSLLLQDWPIFLRLKQIISKLIKKHLLIHTKTSSTRFLSYRCHTPEAFYLLWSLGYHY
eukprot:NODE_146_length_17563_cov_0.253321.p11 type:complete len:101 gc:universal NODE_146_length_17563_cov_0.253321:5022-4720(-)